MVRFSFIILLDVICSNFFSKMLSERSIQVIDLFKKPATQDFIDGATKTFGFWWLGTLEQIKQGQ